MTDAGSLVVDFCGERHVVTPPGPFSIGREADLSVDDNPYLHRTFLELRWDRYWWLTNVGTRLTAEVGDHTGTLSASLAPGGTLPLVVSGIEVRFSAGATTYLLGIEVSGPAAAILAAPQPLPGATTLAPAELTLNQRLTVLALAEASLRGQGRSHIPSSQEAANRLGWTLTRFNRQLDAVCQKLARTGVRGLHGAVDQLASNRRARLVEYALSVRLVTEADLPLLDLPQDDLTRP